MLPEAIKTDQTRFAEAMATLSATYIQYLTYIHTLLNLPKGAFQEQ